jgi:hypothetical protein
MEKNEAKELCLAFNAFLKSECFFNIQGWIMYDHSDYEYQLDELFDYWYDNILTHKH